MADDTSMRASDDAGRLLATLRRYHAAAVAADNDEVVDLAALLADHAHHADVLAAIRHA